MAGDLDANMAFLVADDKNGMDRELRTTPEVSLHSSAWATGNISALNSMNRTVNTESSLKFHILTPSNILLPKTLQPHRQAYNDHCIAYIDHTIRVSKWCQICSHQVILIDIFYKPHKHPHRHHSIADIQEPVG